MNLPRGTLKKISELTNIPNTRICDYAATRTRPRPQRALKLEAACRELGANCPAEVWLLKSSDEIKSRLLGIMPLTKAESC